MVQKFVQNMFNEILKGFHFINLTKKDFRGVEELYIFILETLENLFLTFTTYLKIKRINSLLSVYMKEI